jgi:hypothetical protein
MEICDAGVCGVGDAPSEEFSTGRDGGTDSDAKEPLQGAALGQTVRPKFDRDVSCRLARPEEKARRR